MRWICNNFVARIISGNIKCDCLYWIIESTDYWLEIGYSDKTFFEKRKLKASNILHSDVINVEKTKKTCSKFAIFRKFEIPVRKISKIFALASLVPCFLCFLVTFTYFECLPWPSKPFFDEFRGRGPSLFLPSQTVWEIAPSSLNPTIAKLMKLMNFSVICKAW